MGLSQATVSSSWFLNHYLMPAFTTTETQFCMTFKRDIEENLSETIIGVERSEYLILVGKNIYVKEKRL